MTFKNKEKDMLHTKTGKEVLGFDPKSDEYDFFIVIDGNSNVQRYL